jgi:hypothetical protein
VVVVLDLVMQHLLREELQRLLKEILVDKVLLVLVARLQRVVEVARVARVGQPRVQGWAVLAVQGCQLQLLAHKRTMRAVAGVRATQLAVRLALAAAARGSLEPQTAVRQRLTQAGAAAVLGMMLIQAVFLAVQAVAA